ncbi:MAG TPA: hypothetical protein EYG91_04065 [Aquifex aeolicus]|nr:hypothetical protein [Aquifex aeolicus]
MIEAWANLKEANKVLLLVIALLVALILGLVSITAYLLTHKEVVVYMPPYEKVKVGGRDYILLWAKVFTNYITNFDPDTIENRMNFLLVYAFSDEIKQKLLKEAEDIRRNRITQQFIPFEGSWELIPEKREIKVKGRLRRWIGTKEIQNKMVTFVLYMRIFAGKPYIVGFRYE